MEHVGHKVKGILVVLNVRVQASEIEAVCKVLDIDFAKVFVAAGRDELENWLAESANHPHCANN